MKARTSHGRSPAPSARMLAEHDIPLRHWTVLAQDPSILDAHGDALKTTVAIPAERLERGPKGHRAHVVDYDASTDRYYRARQDELETDHYAQVRDIDKLVRDPHFHQQNAYALVMATLFQFERALGRPVDWGFGETSHQIKVAAHAFEDANAYYSRESESLNFGYFPDDHGKRIFTCLSQDIVVHETTHALLDGLRKNYLNPSSPDQAGFHEGFADIVALLSVFQHRPIIEIAMRALTDRVGRIPASKLTVDAFGNTALARLAEEMGSALEGVHGAALRHSVAIKPDRRLYTSPRYAEEHDRGELLVAIVIRAFLQIWLQRLEPLLQNHRSSLARSVVAEEGSTAAGQLLNIVIRALDYMPPVDMNYRDYLSALLTADQELFPDSGKYDYRTALREEFRKYGIDPASDRRKDGCWEPPPSRRFQFDRHAFRAPAARPHDGVPLRVGEPRCARHLPGRLHPRHLGAPRHPCESRRHGPARNGGRVRADLERLLPGTGQFGIRKPKGMRRSRLVHLYGGGALIFSEYGRLKYHIGTGVCSRHQSERLQCLWDNGYFDVEVPAAARIARMHQHRSLRPLRETREDW